MKVKRLITLIETLAMTGLVSVGFSSWLIVSDPKIVDGMVNVEEVYDNNDYLIIKNMHFSDYYYDINTKKGGFYPDYTYTNDLTKLTSTGILEFDIIIDLNKYRNELITTPSSVKLNLNLSYSVHYDTNQNVIKAFDIISRSLNGAQDETGGFSSVYTCTYDSQDSISYSITDRSTEIAYTNTNKNQPTIFREIVFREISNISHIKLSAIYTFNLFGGFKETDFNYLKNFGIPFKLQAVLENA